MASTAMLDGTPAGTPAVDDGRHDYFNQMRDQYVREGPGSRSGQRDSRAMDFVEMERFDDSRESLIGHMQPVARTDNPYLGHAASASQGSLESTLRFQQGPYDPPPAPPLYPPGAVDPRIGPPRNHLRSASAGSQQSWSGRPGGYFQVQQSYNSTNVTPPAYPHGTPPPVGLPRRDGEDSGANFHRSGPSGTSPLSYIRGQNQTGSQGRQHWPPLP
jgi:hypothetical protein